MDNATTDTLPTAPDRAADPEALRRASEAINLADPSLSLTYGAEAMTEISRFADDLLARVRAKDAGPVGDTLTDLLLKVKDMDLDALSHGKESVLEKLPLIGSLFNSAERAVARFDTLAGQVDAVSDKLDQSMMGLLKDVEILEQLYVYNRRLYDELSVRIEAGKLRLEEAKNVELPQLKAEADARGGAMEAQRVRDFAEAVNRFERRLHDLELSRAVTLQSAPQIRLIQNNDRTLAEKIQTGILSTIPLWKGQMVLALSLHGQRGAARLQKEVSDTTNALLRKNAEMLESATVETAREVERPVVDMETLREVQDRLIASIEQSLDIAAEARAKRADAEKELRAMEEDLRGRLSSLAARKTEQSLGAAEGAEKALPEN